MMMKRRHRGRRIHAKEFDLVGQGSNIVLQFSYQRLKISRMSAQCYTKAVSVYLLTPECVGLQREQFCFDIMNFSANFTEELLVHRCCLLREGR
jgi:hypothetical protein